MKASTFHKQQKAINKIIVFIDRNLSKNLSLRILSEEINISKFYLHRIFKSNIGESLSSYIMRLRLERAAYYLKSSSKSLTEIASHTAYSQQESLSKAFNNKFGLSPKKYRKSEILTIGEIKKNTIINLTHEEIYLEEKKIIYTRIIGEYGSEVIYKKAWKKLTSYAQKNNILNKESEFIGISFNDPEITYGERCRFYACISTKLDHIAKDLISTLKIKAGKYAVFSTNIKDKNNLNKIYKAIYYSYIPHKNIKIRQGINFERYSYNTNKQLTTRIYIAIH